MGLRGVLGRSQSGITCFCSRHRRWRQRGQVGQAGRRGDVPRLKTLPPRIKLHKSSPGSNCPNRRHLPEYMERYIPLIWVFGPERKALSVSRLSVLGICRIFSVMSGQRLMLGVLPGFGDVLLKASRPAAGSWAFASGMGSQSTPSTMFQRLATVY